MKRIMLSCAALFGACAAWGEGVTYMWGRGVNESWATASNWRLDFNVDKVSDAVPGTGDKAYFQPVGTANRAGIGADLVLNVGTLEQPLVCYTKDDSPAYGFSLAGGKKFYLGQKATGVLELDSGTYVFPTDVHIGNGASGSGTLIIDGGEFQIGAGWLGLPRDAQNGSGTIILKSGKLTGTNANSPLVMGYQSSGCTSLLRVEGGEASLTPASASGSASGAGLLLGYSANNRATVEVTGGKLTSTGPLTFGAEKNPSAGKGSVNTVTVSGGEMAILHDIRMGVSGLNTLTVSGEGRLRCVPTTLAANAYRCLYLGYTASDDGSTLNLDGGTLEACHLKYGNATVPATVNFNGGTLEVPINSQSDIVTAHDRLGFYVRAGGAIIKTDENKRFPAVLATGVDDGLDGGLTKRGTGTLTLSAANTFTGPLVVEGGTVNVTGSIPAAKALRLANGGAVTLADPDYVFPSAEIAGGQVHAAKLPACEEVVLSAGALVVTGGDRVPAIAADGEGVIEVVADPVNWTDGVVTNLLTCTKEGATLEGLLDRVVVSGLGGTMAMNLDLSEDGRTLVGTVSSEALLWNANEMDWTAENAWVGEKSGETRTFTAADSVVFRVTPETDPVTNAVVVSTTVEPARLSVVTSEGSAQRLVGSGMVSVEEIAVDGALQLAGTDNAPLAMNVGATRGSGTMSVAENRVVWTHDNIPSLTVEPEGTLLVTNDHALAGTTRLAGSGTLEVNGAELQFGSFNTFAAFSGTISVVNGTVKPNSPLHNEENYIFQNVSTIRLANGKVGNPGVRGSGTNNEWYRNTFDIVEGTENFISNNNTRDGNGAVRLHMKGAFTGAGFVDILSDGINFRDWSFEGDDTAFEGTMKVRGRSTFIFAGNATTLPQAHLQVDANLQLSNCSAPAFGAFEMLSGKTVNNTFKDAELTIGEKGDSLVRGAWTGQPLTIRKVGTSVLTVPGLSAVEGTKLVVASGRLDVNGGEIANAALELGAGVTVHATQAGALADRRTSYPLLTAKSVSWTEKPTLVDGEGNAMKGWRVSRHANENGTVALTADYNLGLVVILK